MFKYERILSLFSAKLEVEAKYLGTISFYWIKSLSRNVHQINTKEHSLINTSSGLSADSGVSKGRAFL